ncbi:zinc finger, GRF-type [Artemisia annua]|uniref:Zinc finger, GRF-type n=1 Tax=Artemisia annua TaxID=35608 RepID=A0A2U1PAR3_ARTAN|nr:zinc finger, GRF-type [Artemisia annua]
MVLCFCGNQCVVKCSWTPRNPGRRFYCCSQMVLQSGTDCGFFEWYDPPMCPRSIQIIPGLLHSRNVLQESRNVLESANRRLKIYLVATWVLFLVFMMM